MPKGNRRSRKVVKAVEAREPRRDSVDKVLGKKLREELAIPDLTRSSFDLALAVKTPEKAGKIPPLGKDSSEEEIEYFGEDNGKGEASEKKVSEREPRRDSVDGMLAGKSKVRKAAKAKEAKSGREPRRESVDKVLRKYEEAKPGAGADDEFDYAFEGKPRDATTHKREYVAPEAPKDIFMKRGDSAGIILEEEVEEAAEEPTRQAREKSIEMTAEQWSAIIDIQYEEEDKESVHHAYTFEETLIYEEAIEALMPALDPSYEIEEYEPSCCLTYNSFVKNLFSQPEFVKKERVCIIHLSEKKFENENSQHDGMLASIYCTIFGEDASNVKRYGKHWEQIGFQGKNPATDLRGTGMWGLCQILFFVEHCFHVMQTIFDYSQDPNYGFPFCAIALNISGMGLDLLSAKHFDAPAIDVGSLHTAFNMWYCGAMNVFFRTWRDSKATMDDSGTIMDLLRKQLLGKATIRNVMIEGSVLSESYIPKEDDEDDEDIEFSAI
ncbi:engulfment/cell motility ELMO domain-containing protein [Chloropicon primus]|uniref:Engulfment/cell motility ELMO domain-containing protein n=1 Tax=Chloropicon primus TaxID=1764295 RepID=A0A5B8MFV6_9CHLO|nr:engulfment/cell motility ELMO domain-containing protein [Chloropicon primus]UPQ98476.1 engulfment/cell motility ELMO domain-containing protein [Chloropicon primus]|eukprot:QDZ19267.1 engulfment/cell motility ELMO domain-containing protein [Chloropicon primus]